MMTQFDRFVGVDVCRDHLDIHCHPDGLAFRVANTPAGIRRLLARLGKGGWAIGCEATGGYENRLLLALSQRQRPGYCLHPSDIRAFTRLKGRRAKTDRLDAKAIAEALEIAVATRKPIRRSKTQSTLKEIMALRRTLIATLNDLKSLLSRLDAPEARKTLDQMIAVHKTTLKSLSREIQTLIAEDRESAAIARRITSAPGAGPVLAAELIASVPELGSLSRRQAASLLGVAPHPRQSGASNRSGRCHGGRATVRRVLYMAALSIVRAKLGPLYLFYEKLRNAGKPFKVATVALMRKLIIAINAMIKTNTDWHTVQNTA